MNSDLINISDNLPSTIEELVDFVVVGNEAIQSFKAKLRACDKSETAKMARDQVLSDGRKVSRLVIDAEDRLGELLINTQKVPLVEPSGEGSLKGSKKSLPVGINKRESHYAQEIHHYPEIVEQIWEEKKNEIPTRHDVLKKIREIKRDNKIQERIKEIEKGIEKPDGLFDTIIIDPPWSYEGKYDADGQRGTTPYPTLSLERLKKINIPAKDDCIMWLWTTHQHIWSAKSLLDTWGFEYKAILVWDKEKMGIGRWLRFQCEFCLLGVKGKPLWNVKDMRDIVRESRGEHSCKPNIFYDLVVNNFPGSILDYFGFKDREGVVRYGTM